MSRTCILSLCLVAGLTVTAAADAATSGTTSVQANQQTDAAAKAGNTDVAPAATASTAASAAVEQELQTVRNRGAAVKAEARAKAESKLNAAARQVEKEVAVKGEADVVARLANEFGVAAEVLTAEKQTLGTSWSELVIAHTLQANTAVAVTVPQVVGLRAEGLGWGQVAAGLGFDLAHAVRAVQSEVKVAVGRAKVDGQVAVIRGSKLDTAAAVKVGAVSSPAADKVGAGVGAGTSLPVVKPGS